MTADFVDLSDTRTWPPLDRLAPGFDGNKAVRSSSVAGREIVFTNSHGSRVSHRFDPTAVDWSYAPGAGDPHPVASGPERLRGLRRRGRPGVHAVPSSR